jgi:hypothetical protein
MGFALVYATDDGISSGGCGILGKSGGFISDGSVIKMTDVAMSMCAASLNSFPVDILRAGIVAHETGHKFGLIHYSDDQISTSVVTNPSSLTFTQFVLLAPTNAGAASLTEGRFYTYSPYTGGVTTEDDIDTKLFDVGGNSIVGAGSIVGSVGISDSVIAYNWLNPITLTNRRIRVYRQKLYIMDWQPRLKQAQPVPSGVRNLRSLSDWVFTSDSADSRSDLNLLTIKFHQ